MESKIPATICHSGNKLSNEIFDKFAERTKLSDITVIHLNPENNQHRGAAAAFKEKEKIRKYGEPVSKMEMDFLPIAFETYGRIGETAVNL